MLVHLKELLILTLTFSKISEKMLAVSLLFFLQVVFFSYLYLMMCPITPLQIPLRFNLGVFLHGFLLFFHLLWYFFSFFFKFYFIFKLYIIALVLPNIKMNPPKVYMCSPSWTLLPPPSPFHPSGSSQCTSPKHPVSCIEPGLAYFFFFANISWKFLQVLKAFIYQQLYISCHF